MKTKLLKKMLMVFMCFTIAFMTMYVVPKQKAHAILPAIIAGQVIKKASSKALASVIVRQGAQSGTVISLKKATQMIGSRMTPAQYQSFQSGIATGSKSLDGKWMKVILGAELAGALALLTSDLADTPQNDKVDFNAPLEDISSGVTRSWSEAIPAGLEGTTVDSQAKFFTGGLHLEFPGFMIVGKNQSTAWYPYLATNNPNFDSDNPPLLDSYFGDINGAYRTWGIGYQTNQAEPNYRLIYITGISAHIETSSTVRLNVFGQTEDGIVPADRYWFPNGESGQNPGHIFLAYVTMTYAEWDAYYEDLLLKESFVDNAQIGDFSKDETYLDQYPLNSPSEGQVEVQIPNPDYWELPGMEDAYWDQLKQFPDTTTHIDPNNYPEDGTDPGTPTDPVTPPAEGTVPGTPTGTTPGEPWIPNGEGCTQALTIPRFLPLVNTISESFPFSIPFDLYDGFQALFVNMGSERPSFDYAFDFNGERHVWDIEVPSFFDSWKTFTDSFLIFVFDVGIIYAFFRFMKGGN